MCATAVLVCVCVSYRLPRGRNQMPYYNQCQDMPPHMQRGHCYPDDFNKMGGPCSYVYYIHVFYTKFVLSYIVVIIDWTLYA